MAEENLKSKTKKGLYWNFVNQFANSGVQFFIGIILARLLSPSDYGTVAMPMVFLVIGQTLADCGFGSALIRKTDLKEEDLSTAFYFSVIVGVVCYLGLFLTSPFIANFYNTPILADLLKFSSLATLFGPICSIQSVQLTRRLDFKTPTKVSLSVRLFQSVVSVVMAYSGCGVWSLVIPSVCAYLLNIFVLYYFVRWFPHTGWSRESFKYLWGYGSKLVASSILEKIYAYIYPIAIGKFFSAAQLGLYTRAQGYSGLPTTTVTSVIQSVTFPVLSKIQNDDERLAAAYQKMIRCSAFVVFPASLMLAALAKPFILIMITEKWAECIPLLQIICIALMLYPVLSLNLNLLQIKGRSDLFLRVEIVNKIIGVLIMIITIPQGLIAMCWGSVATSIINLCVNTYYTGKIINVGLIKQVKELIPISLLSFAMFGFVWGYTLMVDNLYAELIVGGVVGVIVYLGIAYLLRFDELNEIKFMLQLKKSKI